MQAATIPISNKIETVIKIDEKKGNNSKGGFFSRFKRGGEEKCGCGCCGGIKIVPKVKSPEEKKE